jgi:hypothetical protein
LEVVSTTSRALPSFKSGTLFLPASNVTRRAASCRFQNSRCDGPFSSNSGIAFAVLFQPGIHARSPCGFASRTVTGVATPMALPG